MLITFVLVVFKLIGAVTFSKFLLEVGVILFAIKYAEQSLSDALWLCLCVCVCEIWCAHALMLPWICRVALLFSARAPPASVQVLWALRRCFNNNSLQGQTCAPSLHSLSPAMSSPADRGEQWGAQLCKTSFHVISVSRVTLLGLGARLEMDAALILPGLSLPLTQFYPNPRLSVPNHLSLFACLHLPAHCYSLLLATPFLVHFMFM